MILYLTIRGLEGTKAPIIKNKYLRKIIMKIVVFGAIFGLIFSLSAQAYEKIAVSDRIKLDEAKEVIDWYMNLPETRI